MLMMKFFTSFVPVVLNDVLVTYCLVIFTV